MLARLAPFPPARLTSLHAFFENQSIGLLFIDDPYRSYRCSRRTNPLNGENRQLEAMRRELIEVGQVFDVPVILVLHDQVRLPEVLLLEHGPDRGIKGDSIRAHQANALRDEVARCLGGHATVVGQVALLGIVGGCAGLNEYNVAFFQGVPYFPERLVDVVNKDTRAVRFVAKVQHDTIGVAIFEWNTFGPGSFWPSNVLDSIAVRSNMIALDDEIGSGEPVGSLRGSPNALGKLCPAFVHEHCRRRYAWEGDHFTMYRHRQVDKARHRILLSNLTIFFQDQFTKVLNMLT